MLALRRVILLLFSLTGLGGCADADPAPAGDRDATQVVVSMSALSLDTVGDVVWDIEVLNGASQPVWQQRITSSRFGDGAGDATYVGPCDATPGVSQNTVNLWVVGVYADAIATGGAGTFNAGLATGPGAVSGTLLAYQSPTTAQPLSQTVLCVANGDTAVRFNVTLMRPASQGFFDIALNFDDVFCSAKFDCCDDTDGDGCGVNDARLLLFDADGARGPTMVFGFACTAGTGDGVTTALYMDPLQLDCDLGSDASTFVADFTIDPAAAPDGNLCTAGELATCDAVRVYDDADPDAYLFQAAVFRGVEALGVPAGDANVVYWNLALGVHPAIGGCRLRTRATAGDLAASSDGVAGGVIAAGHVYPFVAFDVDLGSCGAEALAFGDPDAPVAATYTGSSEGELAFAYVLGAGSAPGCTGACPSTMPGGVTLLAPECPDGWEDVGSPPTVGPPSVHCASGVSCRLCESPASGSVLPANATFVMPACPTAWTEVGSVQAAGPPTMWCPTEACRLCEAPPAPSEVPLSAVFVAEACPSSWMDVGSVPAGGPSSGTCPSAPCRLCRAP